MQIDKKSLEKEQIELTIKVHKSEATPWLIAAASRISQSNNIKGFRPGKAPYEIVKREFGEGPIISEALEEIVDGTLSQALEQEKIRPYGQVGFDLVPTADPEIIVSYKATITQIPNVTLGNWSEKKIKRTEATVSDEELEKATAELSDMSATEEETDRPAAMGDKVLVDFEVKVDGKVIDGGTASDFALTLGEGRMIPGFEDKIVGSKANDKLEFKLNFPTDYHEHLAGKEADFTVTNKKVLAKIKPVIDDEFAKKLGVKDLAELKEKIKENIKLEKQNQDEERLEIAGIKQVVETTTYGPIPQIMIDDTIKELMHDFEHTLAHQGITLESYLKTSKKSEADMKKDFEPKAIERIKQSLALEELALTEKLTITTTEIEEELEAQRRHFAQRPEVLNDLKQPEYRRHTANTLLNRKLIKFIKDKLVE